VQFRRTAVGSSCLSGIITFTNQKQLSRRRTPQQAFRASDGVESLDLSTPVTHDHMPGCQAASRNAHKWMAVGNESVCIIYAMLAISPTHLSYLALVFLNCVIFSDELGIGAESRPRLGRSVGPKCSRHHQKDQDSETYEETFHGD
jgi:hypothetical protein